jgi:hypothetical protein
MGCLHALAEVDYARTIKPLLKERCYACHGALKQKGGLRMDTLEFMRKGGESGPGILPGDASRSLILERVTTADETEWMPPTHEGERLNAEQVRQLREWVQGGARGMEGEKAERSPREHWAFQPRVRPVVPAVREASWVRNPVDSFVLARLEAEGLRPAPEVSREVLVRRVYVDLVGVPPSWKELQAGLKAAEPDWYERLVDRLLADPRHGERWGRHWMDIWRFSDWWGLGPELRNSQRHMWHFRDWIIESLNADTPYDTMVRLMLAADEIAPEDPSRLRATGFLARNWFLFNRNAWMEETVEHVGKGFLGLTMNCAKCHDHKTDPITQTDFYRVRAVFEPYDIRMDVVPDEVDLLKNGIPRAFDGRKEVPTYRFIRGEESRPDKTHAIAPDAPHFFRERPLAVEPVALPVSAAEPERQPWVLDAYLAAAKRKFESARKAYESARRGAEPEPHPAGSVSSEETPRTSPGGAALEMARLEMEEAEAEWTSTQRRVEAVRAGWTHGGSELEVSARMAAVRAERDWAVASALRSVAVQKAAVAKAAVGKRAEAEKKLRTAEEELQKARASAAKEPVAADGFRPLPGAKWMATRFLNSSKDDPIVSFPKTSSGRRKAFAEWVTDTGNPLTARVAVNHLWGRHFGFYLVGTPFDFGRAGSAPTHPELLDWLASEWVEHGWSMKHLHRLLVTSSTYRMSSSTRGREAEQSRDPDNRMIWRRVPIRMEGEAIRDSMLALSGAMDWTLGGPSITGAAQAASKRRSVYFFHSNNERDLFLTTFDGAMVRECYRREQSVLPQQALAMINGTLSQESAKGIQVQIERALRECGMDSDAEFVRAGFLYVTGVPPEESALAASLRALERWKGGASNPGSQAKAREAFLWVLLNHNDFVTLR